MNRGHLGNKRNQVETFVRNIERIVDSEFYLNGDVLLDSTITKANNYYEEIHEDRMELLNLELGNNDYLKGLVTDTIKYLPVTDAEQAEAINLVSFSNISKQDKNNIMSFLLKRGYID